ncbi:YiiX/YebB-like N1pC/P60 family cysteine hydrolase [Thermodesulfobacteriota bacterium]
MVYEHEINGIPVQTGDIICTTDGSTEDIKGQFWRLIGKLIPGEIDHTAIYVGPEGRCVEAGAKARVITYSIEGETWDADAMYTQRGIMDSLYGIVFPLADKDLSSQKMTEIRKGVAEYCLEQADKKKPYNLNFLNSGTEDAFYCSQLAYKAYLEYGIDLNTGIGVPEIPFTESIIFPQEIWNGCEHTKVE